MKMFLVAQSFSPFQVISIQRGFNFKNIRLFSILISMKLLFYFLLHCDNKYVSSNLIAYLLINKSYVS